MKKKTIKLELKDKDIYTITVREIESVDRGKIIEENKNKRVFYKLSKKEVLDALSAIL